MVEDKGILRSELESIVSKLHYEYYTVKEAFVNASNGNGKYRTPSLTYLSFFVYPIMFLDPILDETTANLSSDFSSESLYFTGTYLSMVEYTQKFLAANNLQMLKKLNVL